MHKFFQFLRVEADRLLTVTGMMLMVISGIEYVYYPIQNWWVFLTGLMGVVAGFMLMIWRDSMRFPEVKK